MKNDIKRRLRDAILKEKFYLKEHSVHGSFHVFVLSSKNFMIALTFLDNLKELINRRIEAYSEDGKIDITNIINIEILLDIFNNVKKEYEKDRKKRIKEEEEKRENIILKFLRKIGG